MQSNKKIIGSSLTHYVNVRHISNPSIGRLIGLSESHDDLNTDDSYIIADRDKLPPVHFARILEWNRHVLFFLSVLLDFSV